MLKRLSFMLTMLLLTAGLLPVSHAQGAEPHTIHGNFSIAYPGYESFNLVVGLTDASGLFGKDPGYIAPKEKQMLGKYTGNAASGSYEVTLPAEPEGRPIDLTGQGQPSNDVLIFDIRLLSDVASHGYMVPNEDALASSLKLTVDAQVKGGTLLVWAADDKAQFPTDYGADKKLFTADDPRVPLALGWSLVNLDSAPFQISREPDVALNLTNTGGGDIVDLSALSCDQLIPTFLDRVQATYPFTDLKKIDWKTLRDKVIPSSKTAKTEADCERLVRDIANAIPDGHVNFSLPALQEDYAGSLGLRLAPTSDGKIVVVLIRDNGPAATAGVKLGAEITAWEGKPIQDVLPNVVLQSTNASTTSALLDARLSDLPRGPMGSTVEITFKNPGAQPVTAKLTRDQPQRSNGVQLNPPPVKDNKLPSGLGYIHIDAFEGLQTLQSFDQTLDQLIKENVPGIVIDIRSNPGGLSQMSDAMASRFYDKGFIVGKNFSLDGRFVYEDLVEPRQPLYTGCVVVLVDLYTASSGDLFAYTMQLGKRATIVGNTPTQGLGGTVSGGYYILPNNGFIQVPTGGMFNEKNEIALEGKGVEPDVQVPVTVESLLSPVDRVLDAGVNAAKDCKAPLATQAP